LIRDPDLLQQRLGYRFRDAALLQQALTHRSAGKTNNERLEFLGDAILGAVIAAELYRRYPVASEGRLSRLRATLVRRESLAEVARLLQLGDFLLLGTGERRSGGHRRGSILSDALEALLGAVYLDSGFAACNQCILEHFSIKLDALEEVTVLKDPKTRLQEYLQAQGRPLPGYLVLEVSGEAHAQWFRISCDVEGTSPCTGTGNSRRKAEQEAAGRMLQQLTAESGHER
jgi:ribonuclease III